MSRVLERKPGYDASGSDANVLGLHVDEQSKSMRVDPFAAPQGPLTDSFSAQRDGLAPVISDTAAGASKEGLFTEGRARQFRELGGKKKASLFEEEDVDFDDTNIEDLNFVTDVFAYTPSSGKVVKARVQQVPEEKLDEALAASPAAVVVEDKETQKALEDELFSFSEPIARDDESATTRKKNAALKSETLGKVDALIASLTVSPMAEASSSSATAETADMDDISAYIAQNSAPSPSKGLFD